MEVPPVLGSPHPVLNRLEPARPRRVAAHPWAARLAVATVCVGAFLGQLTASIVSAALPGLAGDLHTGPGAASWISLAYLVTLVALVAPLGAWSDAVGRKALYVAGFVVFTVASLGCALAPDLPVLCALRVVQAAGAALLQANSVALIAGSVPRERLGRALGMQATAQAVGLATGPAIGGLLLTLGSWRLLFATTVPLGAIGIVTGLLLLPRSRDLATSGRVPLRRSPLLRDALIVRGLVLGLAGFVVLFGVMVAVPFWLTGSGRASAAHASLLLTGLPVGVALAAPWSGRLAQRAAARTADAGLLLSALAVAALALRPPSLLLVGVLVLLGLGLGLFNPANTTAVMSRVSASQAGSASGLLNLVRGLGTALGTGLAASAAGLGGSAGRTFVPVVGALCVTAVAAATLGRAAVARGGRMGG
ncbi:MAG TPA: MFS transporter [Mycobacteriales bacterium]|nr:MFS transporter [Mycobacteriales bacterium]